MDFIFEQYPDFADILELIELVFLYFIQTCNISETDTTGSGKKRGTFLDLRKLFKYQEDLDRLILIVADLIFRRNSIDWYMPVDLEPKTDDQFYGQ
jgi:hypothetical protein